MPTFQDQWRYQAVRLLEINHATLPDTYANEQALAGARQLADQLLTRSRVLSLQHGLDVSINRILQSMYWGGFLLCTVCLFLGISAGLAAIGPSAQAVNVLWTLASILLLPTLGLIIWIISICLGIGTGGWLGHLWQTIVKRVLNKGQDATVWRAWIELSRATGSQRWWFGLITHAFWLSALTGVLIALAFSFSFRHYTFMWQTTWLTPDIFVQFAQLAGSLPALLGISLPSAELIQASGNVAIDEPVARTSWANWLLATILIYGWFTRLLALVVCALVIKRRYQKLRVRTDDAYALSTRDRIEALSATSRSDALSAAADNLGRLQGLEREQAASSAAAALLECKVSDNTAELLRQKGALLSDIDSRQSRQIARDRLSQLRPMRLLIIVDARQTPDRGALRAILSMGAHAVETAVCLDQAQQPRTRSDAWRSKLQTIGATVLFEDINRGLGWLARQES
jgi:hypothetical protein